MRIALLRLSFLFNFLIPLVYQHYSALTCKYICNHRATRFPTPYPGSFPRSPPCHPQPPSSPKNLIPAGFEVAKFQASNAC